MSTGELAQDCLPDVLRRLYVNRESGELKLSYRGRQKAIYFELGAIIFASSDAKEDRIGETMMRHGTLSQADFERASAIMRPGKRFGQTLVELGILSDRDLLMNVTFQILDIVYSVFEWPAGTYEFTPQDNVVPADLRLDLSTASIILEGVRRIKDFQLIQRGLGDLNRLIGPSTSPLLRLQTLSLKPIERQIIDAVKEPMNVLQLLLVVGAPPDVVLRGTYGLLSAGVLERLGAPKINKKTGRISIPKSLYAQAAQAQPVVTEAEVPNTSNDPALMELIGKLRDRLMTNDPYIILGVTWHSTQDEIRDAYYRLAKDLHPDRFQGAAREVRQDVEFLFTRITSCYEMLKTPTSSKSAPLPPPPPLPQYSAPLSPPQVSAPLPQFLVPPSAQQSSSPFVSPPAAVSAPLPRPPVSIPTPPVLTPLPSFENTPPRAAESRPPETPVSSPVPKPAPPAANEGAVVEMLNQLKERLKSNDPYDALGVTRQSTREDIRDAYHRFAKEFHPDRHRTLSREVLQEIEQIFSRITTCYEALRNHTPQNPAVPPLATPGGVSALNETPYSPPAAIKPTEESSTQRAQRAETMYLEARNRYISKEYVVAAHLMREAIRLEPGQGRYYLLLGNCLSTQQKTLKEAEPILRKAVELDPFNAVCRASLGQLYLRAGMPKQAEREFEEALKLDSTQQTAIRGLDQIRASKNEGGFLNKLFKS